MNTTIASPDLAISICAILASLGGLLANGTVVLTIACSHDLRRKDFIYFILNRTLIDLVYSITLATIHPIAVLTAEPTSSVCVVAGFVEVALSSATVFAEPLLACNRYVSILRNDRYKNIYSMRNVYLMCTVPWMLGVMTTLPHIFVGSLGRVPGSICVVRFAPETMLVTLVSNYSFLFLCMVSTAYFNWSMYRFLNKYQKQPMANNEKTKLQSDREMLRFICATALLPLILELPALAAAWIHMFVPTSSGWLMFAGIGSFLTSFVVNPLITLMMVRPIKCQLLARVRKAIGRRTSSIAVLPLSRMAFHVEPVGRPTVGQSGSMARTKEMRNPRELTNEAEAGRGRTFCAWRRCEWDDPG